MALMQANLGVPGLDTVKLYLPLTRVEFYRLTKGRVPRWAGGVAYPEQSLIVVKAPTFFDEGVPVEVLAAHEVAHLYLHRASGGGELPRWLDEGLACLLSGESRSGSLALLGRAAAAGRLMGLPSVDDVLGFSTTDADLAYTEARLAAGALVDKYGWVAVRAILSKLSTEEDFPKVFLEATGVEYEFWQVEWLETTHQRYKFVALLEIDNLIWIVIFLLGAMAVIAVWIRQRIQFKRWLEEEEDEDTDDNTPITP